MTNKRDDKRSIILTLDSAHKVKIEPYREFKTSLFRGVYENAAFMIMDIINAANRDTGSRSDNAVTNSEPICNIISYMGERGEGKTSSMLSFCNFLAKIHTMDFIRGKVGQKYSVLDNLIDKMQNRNACFQVLDCIDVTLLGQDETIVDIILGKMLDKIKKCDKQSVGEIKIAISRIYDSLHRKNVYDDAALAVLTGRSKSWKLREAFLDLFHQFNKLFAEKYDCKSCYTVLMIDDIDMNVEHCYDMLEMIRQYLMLPNVIIMMSINYGQLETVCQNYYFGKLFLGTPGDEQLLQSAARSSAEMTKAYLEKILPDGRRLYMPDLYREDGAFEKKVGITSTNKNTGEVHHFDIKQVILYNLHRYVRIPFDGNNGEIHYLQPDTLRQLNDYIMQFNHLMILDGARENDIKAYEYNSRWFYDDLMNRYIEKQLDKESIKKVKEFLGTNLNDKLQYLYRYLRKQLLANSDEMKEEKFNPKKIGYGEIIQLIRMIEQNDLMDWKEIQSMKSLLSLIMTRMVFMINKWKEIIYGIEKGEEEQVSPKGENNFKPEDELSEWKRSFEDFTRSGIWSRVIENAELTGYKKDTGMEADAAEAAKKEEQVKAKGEESDKLEETAEAGENLIMGANNSRVSGFGFDRKIDPEKEGSLKKAILLCELASLFLNINKVEIKENVQGSEARNELLEPNLPAEISLSGNRSYRFGSFIYNIWNYEDCMKALEEDIISKVNLSVTEDTIILYQEMKEWELKYKTTAVVPFYSVEVMNMIADKLKYNVGDNYGNEFFITPKSIGVALKSIQDTLEEVDEFYKMEGLIMENSEKEVLGVKYSEIFQECPAVKHIRDKETYNKLEGYLGIIMETELSERGLGGDYEKETKD